MNRRVTTGGGRVARGWVRVLMALSLAAAGSVAAAPAAPPAARASIEGVVTHVTDGDTVTFAPKDGSAPRVVRLLDIDAPEICQSGGVEARAYLSELLQRQTVRLVPASAGAARDSYGRVLGTLWVADVQVNRRMVEEGHAWSVRTKWDRGPLVTQERMAKALSRGLHAGPDSSVPPWDFRKRHGPCQGTAAEPVARSPAPTPPPAPPPAPPGPAAPPRPAVAPTPAPPVAGAFRCDGRRFCSQMSSCAEATYFLRHCPNVQMDGDGDGVPCESQWCTPGAGLRRR